VRGRRSAAIKDGPVTGTQTGIGCWYPAEIVKVCTEYLSYGRNVALSHADMNLADARHSNLCERITSDARQVAKEELRAENRSVLSVRLNVTPQTHGRFPNFWFIYDSFYALPG
jgi:hypothetical protein